MTTNRIKILGLQWAVFVVVLLCWEAAGRSSPKAFFLAGTPSAVGSELLDLIGDNHLLFHFAITAGEAIVGLLIGTVLGSLAGLTLWYSRVLALVARPFVIALGTLPVFAFAPLMIVWFGVGFKMKVAMAAFSTIFVSFTQGYKGASSVSIELIESLQCMDATKSQIFIKVIVPGSIEWVLSSMRLNVGFGLLGALIGEFVASDAGLGHVMLRSAALYNIPRALAASIGITILALALDWVAQWIERRSQSLVQWISVPKALRLRVSS